LDDATIIRALQASKAEAAAGRMAESDQLLARLAQHAPNHPAVLNELGVRMLDRSAAEQAHALFVRATNADPNHPSLWANLASSLKALGRRAEEMDALEKALRLQPRHLSALLQKAAYFEDSGDLRTAARTYQNALACIPPGAEPAPAVREAVTHAKKLVEDDRAALNAALEGSLAAIRERHGGGRQRRVELCLEALMGKRQVFYSQPTWMYFPELPAIEFFERAEFPWLDAIEAASDEIRAELLRVLVADRDGLQPYIDFPPDMPLDQFRELNRSQLERLLPLEPGRSKCRTHRALPGDRAGARSRAAAPADRGTRADGIFLDPGRQYPDSPAYRRNQHAPHGAPAAHRPARVRLPGRRDDARVAAGQGVGVR